MLAALPSCGDNSPSGPGPQKPDGGGSGSQHEDAGLDGPGADPHLILHYAFEDSATAVTDSSSRQKDGTLNAVSGWTADGRVGRALAMTGGNPANVFVSMPDGVLTDVDDFTIAFWVKMNTVADWARVYDFGNGLADPQNRFMYFTPAGFSGVPAQRGTMASSYGGAASNELVALSPTILPTGAWKHVAIVGTSGARTIYVDGYPALKVENGPMVPPREMEPMGNASWLGKGRFPDPGLDGTLDEFMIYDRALTQAEVADLAWPGMDYSYWRFDEGTGGAAKDSSDRNIPTALGTGVTWKPGRLGMALDFPGGAAGATGPTVTLATNPLANCTTELSVSAWIKLDAVQNWARVFDFGTGDTRFIYLAPSDGAGMHFAMVSEHGLFDLVAPAPVAADGNWHHVAATVAADGTVNLYIDGANVKTGSSPMVKPSDFATMSDLWLGKSRFNDPYLDGAIDELRIGCRALTADEIMTLSRR
ncbi:MAG: LamG domain-containing protein [Kofleriaceae bacterium]|nr:LamG domain-containing protein [Kofleriaceae bacterium]